jgi:predicted metal-dependent peptidase
MNTPVKPVNPAHDTSPLTPEEIKEAQHLLVKARIKLIFNHPFFGQLALRLIMKPAEPQWCKTAATDGRHFYYNPRFVKSLTDEENVFLVAHELGHCIFEHFMRRGSRDPKLWNIAGDYIINNTLETELVNNGKHSCAKVITNIFDADGNRSKIFLDHKYDGWTTEEVYDDLVQQQKDGGKPEDEGTLLDTHIDMNGKGGGGDGEEDGDGNIGEGQGGEDENGVAKGPGKLTDEERKGLSNEIRDALIQAAQAAGAGKVPGDMKRLVSELTEPKLDWRDIIRAQIESSIKSNYSFMRVNRKSFQIPAILPGMDNSVQIDVCLAIDTSGSISTTMLKDFVSEVAGIMDQYENYRVRIWQFDTAVYGFDEFTSDDGRDMTEYDIKGGGGTDFDVNWQYMKENEIEPDQFIMFTDGQPWNSWGDADYCDTVFLIHTAYGKPVAPFGETIYYNSTGMVGSA